MKLKWKEKIKMSSEIRNELCIITAPIWRHKELSIVEKCLLGRINALSQEQGYCFAGNSYLAKDLGKSIGWISDLISKLVKDGYLLRTLIRDEKGEIEKRILKINWDLFNNYYKEQERYGLENGEVSGEKRIPVVEKPEYREDIRIDNRNKINIGDLNSLPLEIEVGEIKVAKKRKSKTDRHSMTEEEEKWFDTLDEKTIEDLTKKFELNRFQLLKIAGRIKDRILAYGYEYKDFKRAFRSWLPNEKDVKYRRQEIDPNDIEGLKAVRRLQNEAFKRRNPGVVIADEEDYL